MRVVLFGAGSPLSLACLRELTAEELVAVVVPYPQLQPTPRALFRSLRHRRGARALISAAKERGVRLIRFDPLAPHRAAENLARLKPDLYLIAAFPWLLRHEVIARARLGAINVHFSVLPHHRGPSPLAQTYLADDRTTGVSLHWISEHADTGDIVAQMEMPLERGRPVRDLYFELCEHSAALLRTVLLELDAGRVVRHPQPSVEESSPDFVDIAAWPAERVWHVLSGLGGDFGSLISVDGRPIHHGAAFGYEIMRHGRAAGSLQTIPQGYRIYCVDGAVDVATRFGGRIDRRRSSQRTEAEGER